MKGSVLDLFFEALESLQYNVLVGEHDMSGRETGEHGKCCSDRFIRLEGTL
jgi:hypothetical protein